MNTTFTIIIFSFVVSGFSSYNDNTIIGKYYHSWGYSSIELELTQDGKFLKVHSSCTVDLLFKGTWKINNDTLILNKLEYSDSKNKIWMQTFNEQSDYLVFKDSKLFYLEKTDSATFVTDLILEKKNPVIESKTDKRKGRKK